MTNQFGEPPPRGWAAPAPRRPNGATAIIAGIAALAVGGMLGALPVQRFIVSGVEMAPARLLVVLGLYLGGALLLVWGALMTFFRSVAGAILLLLGALVAIAAVVLEPILLYPGMFAEFFQAVFQLAPELAFARIAGAVGGPLVFLLAVLPSTFRYLRYRPSELSYGVPLGYSRQGW
ncbi:hypothetical protein [Amycolatopsis taiwanensis]|uniref:Uncharacterized protein n=1 Tax=Amycolatopsis taiwanensis TaxID=342230 RepID=A0A9W6QVB8_9PSEU|nr:hypothetical protein [Amycolatopsis taiwanensis]GLY64398.1 hypothetical protein Atai01_10170 [Amycolatopsis taiwanensis]